MKEQKVRKFKLSIPRIITHAILIFVTFIVAFPVIYTICASFKTNQELLANPGSLLPLNPTFDNYITAWNSPSFNVPLMLFNSLYYTLFNVTVNLFVSSMSGYVFARGDFPLKRTILYTFTSLMFITIVGVGVYPQFEVLKVFGLTSSLFSLMVMYVFTVQIVNTYLIRGYVQSLPKEIDEAAKIDGCSFIGIFFRIIMPLLKPILATVAILGFNGSWNEYMMPTIFTLTVPQQRTLIVGVVALKTSSGAASQWNLMLAGSTIALIPVLVAYAVANKHFVSGLSAGAVKG